MYKLTTFKQYLNEAWSPRTVPISAKSAFEIIDKDCSAFARSMSKQQIYRGGSGMGNERVYYGNSNSGNPRKSANTANYFTLWHDNNPEWADFPKRSRSFICSNDFFIASSFGDVHLMVPRDDAHIGIVPDEDLFGAIQSPDGEYLNDFNDIIRLVLKAVAEEYKLTTEIETYKQLVDCLKLATKEVLERRGKGEMMTSALEHLEKHNAKSYLEIVDECYSPKGKGFKQGKASSIKLPSDGVELYLQGEAVFLPYSNSAAELENFPPNYIELLQKAMERYNWDIDA